MRPPPGALKSIQDVLRVNGDIPRRAVLLADGSLADKTAHPQLGEVDVLSRVCELATGSSVPRHTAPLLDVALRTNEPSAWLAIRDDLLTGDFDPEAAAAVVQQTEDGTMYVVSSMLNARDSAHMAAVVVALAALLPALTPEARDDLGRALACHVQHLMEAFTKHSALLTRDVRDAVLSGFGKILARTGMCGARATDMVLLALKMRREELLRLFLYLPRLAPQDQLAGALVAHAKLLPTTKRYPVLAMLAKVACEGVASAADHADDIDGLVVDQLVAEGPIDSRTCLAIGTLVGCAHPGHALVGALGRGLVALSAALLSK